MPNAVTKHRILLIDDDSVSLAQLGFILDREGFTVETANDGIEGLARLKSDGTAPYSALITDYQMPGLNGIELLEKVRVLDPTLATIIITSNSERETISASLKGGAIDFLEKPINRPSVRSALERAIAHTLEQRRIHAAVSRLSTVASIQQRLAPNLKSVNNTPGFLNCELTTRNCPIHEAGGDFISVFRSTPHEVRLVLGDVSGHGVIEGFIASYFQGMVKGMQTLGASAVQIADACNRFLLYDWSGGQNDQLPSSLSAVFLSLNLEHRELTVYNCGCPAVYFYPPEAPPIALAPHGTSLGWFDDLAAGSATVKLPDNGVCCLWSDGLTDYAAQIQVTPHAAAAQILLSAPHLHHEESHSVPFMDDILIARVRWFSSDQPLPEDSHLIYHESVSGDSSLEIDAFQARFQRNLTTALPSLNAQILHRVILCTREALLNALEHGCEKRADLATQVYARYYPKVSRIEITVEDPGPGHVRQPQSEPPDLLNGTGHISLGIQLIQTLTSGYRTLRNGATVIMDFSEH